MPFALFVSNNTFKGQLPGETTLLVTRKHWLTLALPLLLVLLFLPLPFLAIAVLPLYWHHLAWFLAIVYWLTIWNLLFFNLMIYLLNTVIVTNKRVIENKQLGFFSHVSNELQKDKIQDISVKINGVLASLFNFGDLQIQTAGSQPKFDLTRLPNPDKIKQLILG